MAGEKAGGWGRCRYPTPTFFSRYRLLTNTYGDDMVIEQVSCSYDPSRDIVIYAVGKEVEEVSARLLADLSLAPEEYFELYVRQKLEKRLSHE